MAHARDTGGAESPPSGAAAEIVAALATAADPARAVPMAAYMRDRFAFLGVPTPLRRQLARRFIALAKRPGGAATALVRAQGLWRERWRECHYVAVDLLAACAPQLPAAALADLERLIVTHSWRDSVDALAKHAVGALVRNHPGTVATIDRWAVDPNLWLRRTAILHQLGAKGATDRERLFRHCRANGGDPEFFIRKGIGWALREYAYVDPDAVRDFLDAHRGALSPLSVREASKHLAPRRAAGSPRRSAADPAR
jgi:3-methyladenine DNA glycosylase AlkD